MKDVSKNNLESLLDNKLFPSCLFTAKETELGESHKDNFRNIQFGYEFDTQLYMYAETEVTIIDAFKNVCGGTNEEELLVKVDNVKIPNFYNRVESGGTTFGVNEPDTHKQLHRYVVKESPLIIKKEGNAKSLNFYAVNIPQFEIIANECEVALNNATLKITSIQTLRECKQGRSQPTHFIEVSYLDKNGVDLGTVEADFFFINNVLMLISGQYAGVGHATVYDSTNNQIMQVLGFCPVDPLPKQKENWYRKDPGVSLQNIFSGFKKITQRKADLDVVRRALHYYRAANILTRGREVTLVASCSGIEAIIGHYLREKAGWTKNLISRSNLSDRMSAAAALIDLTDDPLEHCPKLQDYKKAHSLSAFEILAKFRNKLVHSDPAFEYDGIQLLEAYNVFQWFLENLLLSAIGYNGGYRDRRKYTGFTTTDKIPYKKSLLT